MWRNLGDFHGFILEDHLLSQLTICIMVTLKDLILVDNKLFTKTMKFTSLENYINTVDNNEENNGRTHEQHGLSIM